MNLDLEKLADQLEKTYSVKRMKRFLVVETSDDVKITVMRAGTLVVKGIANADEAKTLLKEIIGRIG